jgi:hypothetical protein
MAESAAILTRIPLAGGLGADLLELDALHHRQRRAGRALVRVAEGAAVGLDPLADGLQELALPFGELDPGLVGGALGAAQGVEGGALGRLFCVRRSLPLQLYSPPIAER